MTTEKPCNPHPDAPHGFVRNASHSVGHYVCECSGWAPPASLQEELRSVPERSRTTLEAADRIDALENEMARIRELWEADQIESSEQRTQIHQLRAQVEELNKDAARYQWLRTCKHDSLVLNGDTQFCELMMEEVLDNAIDTAMKESK